MKKIILLIVVGFLTGLVSAQEAPTKQLSIEEANRLNGTPKEPTVNGKPYSQYKAEQEVLKQQQNNKKAVLPSDVVALNAADAKPALVKAVQPVENKSSNGLMVDDGKTDPLKAAIEMSKTVAKAKETVVQKPVIVDQAPVLISEMLKTPTKPEPPAAAEPKNNQPVINENTKPVEKEKPQVPEQFRLPANASWGNAVTTEMPVRNNVTPPQIKDNPAQSVKAQVVAEPYKTPAVKESNNTSGDDGKSPVSKPAEIKVDAATTKEEATPAPEVPVQLRLPAAQSWNGRPVTAAATSSTVTEKPAARSAAEIEAAKAAQQQADDKSKKPAIDASKAAVQEVKVAQQETASAPKKD